MQTDQNRTRLTRSASCDTHVAFSDNAHAYHRSHERNSKRSMSGPSLDKDSSVFGGVNLKYFSSGVNATIAAERNVRHQGMKNNPETRRKYGTNSQDKMHLTHITRRSKSWNANVSDKFPNVGKINLRDSRIAKRPKTAPCFPVNAVIPDEASTSLIWSHRASNNLQFSTAYIRLEVSLM